MARVCPILARWLFTNGESRVGRNREVLYIDLCLRHDDVEHGFASTTVQNLSNSSDNAETNVSMKRDFKRIFADDMDTLKKG